VENPATTEYATVPPGHKVRGYDSIRLVNDVAPLHAVVNTVERYSFTERWEFDQMWDC